MFKDDIHAAAHAKGYTDHFMAYSDGADLDIYVKPDADLDSRFDAICAETGEGLRINGWLFSFEKDNKKIKCLKWRGNSLYEDEKVVGCYGNGYGFYLSKLVSNHKFAAINKAQVEISASKNGDAKIFN